MPQKRRTDGSAEMLDRVYNDSESAMVVFASQQSLWITFMCKILMIAALLGAGGALPVPAQGAPSAEPSSQVTVDKDGTVHVPTYAMPLSVYMSDEAKRTYVNMRLHWPPGAEFSSDISQTRKAIDEFARPKLDRARSVYAVTVEKRTIAGVRAEVVTPVGGVAPNNTNRVLICLHGGGFQVGSGVLQLLEAIPIAATARIKVISIDYRLSPEHKFPAASEDVAAVYRELLREYRPQNIGIYGSSSGGTLTAMSVAWFQKERLPMPGAIGLFTAHNLQRGGDLGDSFYTATPLAPLFNSRRPAPPVTQPDPNVGMPYFAGGDNNDPLMFPLSHPEVLTQFPPTLIVTGTRDLLGSSLIAVHRKLVRAGVDSQLELWEGMWHGFIGDVDLPESKEVYSVAAKFFVTHLGRAPQGSPRQ